jgi:hypothetical protein
VDPRLQALNEMIDLPKLVGYLNFSNGRPDPRFQAIWNQAQTFVAGIDPERPWQTLSSWLVENFPNIQAQGGSAFGDLTQAREVLSLLTEQVIPEYVRFHENLFNHLPLKELCQPYFVVRTLETILAQGGPWDDPARVVPLILDKLNDFLGYRPVATLENKQLGEPYRHERFRPIPLYLRDAGVGGGPFRLLITEAINILKETPPEILEDASFDLALLEEWACDPRLYDHAHPANRRPNYVFGEWDPHQLDKDGNYRRYVTRLITLQSLMNRLEGASETRRAEYFHEAGIVLAGTVLMASAMSGRGPGSYDSNVKLANLVPKIARLRDRYYEHRFDKLQGVHKGRLQEEAGRLRQPFAGARQHLNQAITKHRADQLQRRHVALFLAEIGAFEPAWDRVHQKSPVSTQSSVRLESALTTVERSVESKNLAAAADALGQLDKYVHQGIECGALPDPWNALGFQGQFPIFQSMEDAVQDHRLHELCDVMDSAFRLAGRVLCEAAASGQHELAQQVRRSTKRLATWWDQFATAEVSDLPRVVGEELLQAAQQVMEPLADWHRQGGTTADLTFWRQHLDRFRSASSFALVVDVLLLRGDYAAAMGLLINWLSHASEVPLEDGEQSYFHLMIRWTLEVLGAEELEAAARWKLLKRFLDLLEANAEEYWDLSAIEIDTGKAAKKEDDNPFAAAYEGMQYRDSTDDGHEGSLADDDPKPKVGAEFPLEHQAEDITQRIRFLAHVSHLWRLLARQANQFLGQPDMPETLQSWCKSARQQGERLMPLLDTIQACKVPEPLGSHASMVEYDRQRLIKERTIEAGLTAALDVAMAERSLLAASHVVLNTLVPSADADDWSRQATQIENLTWRGEVAKIPPRVDAFLRSLSNVSLLYRPLDAGGQLGDMFETRLAQSMLRDIIVSLPRMGLYRETYTVLKAVRDQERAQSVQGRVVTEFNRLFELAMHGLAISVARSSQNWEPKPPPSRLVHFLDQLAKPFLMLWIDHSHSVRLSSLETISGDEDWKAMREFIRKFGSDLFHTRFMTLANLRAILNRGVDTYLNYLEEEAETARDDEPVTGAKLLGALRRNKVPREQAVRHLELVLKAVVENFEEYKDYNATTTQSDYGENLFRLLAFLRLKSAYERHVWNIKPLVWIHETLAREGHDVAALLWQQTMARLTSEVARRHVEHLRELQSEHGMQLRTVADLVEEHFIAPLEVDRLTALVAPAMKELNQQSDREFTPALVKLLQAVDVQANKTTGSGLDVPAWIRKLEQEGEYVTSQVTLEKALEPPVITVAETELDEQLKSWEIQAGDVGLLPG